MRISVQKNNAAIVYDIGLEAIYSILVLCDYDILSPYSLAYQQEIKEEFTFWKNTEVFHRIESMTKAGFRFNRPVILALSAELHENELILSKAIPSFHVDLLGGNEKVQELLKDINSFLSDTDFLRFFKRHELNYRSYLANHSPYIFEVISDIDNWYKPKDYKYTVYISKLIHPGGFGHSFSHQEPVVALGAILNPDGDIDRYITYNTIFHEISHHFIDKYIKESWESIENYLDNSLFPDFPDFLDLYVFQQEYIAESMIRGLSNYYCKMKDITIDRAIFSDAQYPLSENIFNKLMEMDIRIIDNELLDILIRLFLKEA